MGKVGHVCYFEWIIVNKIKLAHIPKDSYIIKIMLHRIA